MNIDDGNDGDEKSEGTHGQCSSNVINDIVGNDDDNVGNDDDVDADEQDLLPEVPPRQKHHEVRPRNLAKALGVILVKEGAPPELRSETPNFDFIIHTGQKCKLEVVQYYDKICYEMLH